MRTFAQKQNRPQKQAPSSLARPHKATPGPTPREHPLVRLQRTIGNQAVLGLLQTHAEELKIELPGITSSGLGHNFSRVPIHPPVAEATQMKLAVNEPGDEFEQEADHVAEEVMRMPEPKLQRTCACGGSCLDCQTEQPAREHARFQAKHVGSSDARTKRSAAHRPRSISFTQPAIGCIDTGIF